MSGADPRGMDAADDEPLEPPTVEATDAPTEGRARSKDPARALVYVQKLSKVYATRRSLFRAPELLHALSGVSFYLKPKETLGIIGESGSGKSTLARAVLRLTEPTLGRVVFDGLDLMALSPRELRAQRRRMQIVLQNPATALAPHMTLSELVAEGIDAFGLAASRKDRLEQVVGYCHRVGLDERLLERYPHELSGGRRRP